ncbi:MAG TPA: ArsA-related P-loop ATPase [Acidimicrobiales bacterium]|nr:ArsA-related P-loop ATPase [Acidimicrobiales bacterium]
MRLAFVGKGGAGKSAISGTFARILAREGHKVLAIDSDPLPGLAYSLGLAIDHSPPIPDDAVVERKEGEEGPRWRLNPEVDPFEAVEKWSVEAPDGVRFLQFGKIKGDQNLWRSQIAFRFVINKLPEGRWNVVGDLPGGTRQAFTGWGSWAHTVLIVVEPTAKSLLSGRRLARMADLDPENPKRVMAVASKVREPDDVEMIAKGTGLEVIASVPWDEELAEAERRQLAPIDYAPDAPAVRAVESLVERLSELRVS